MSRADEIEWRKDINDRLLVFFCCCSGSEFAAETGLEVVLAAEAISIEKTDLGHNLLRLGSKVSLTLISYPPSSAGL